MVPTFFETAQDFRKWLKANHDKASELLVGFFKVGSGRPSMTWSESVDQALCFGWIDGVRKSLGSESYTIRFTPRKAGSNWSTINIKKVEELSRQGLMQPAGNTAFAKRTGERSGIYSYEKEATELDPALIKKFKTHKKAWAFFSALSLSNKRLAIHRVMDAKRPATRVTRLEKLIVECEAGRKPTDSVKYP